MPYGGHNLYFSSYPDQVRFRFNFRFSDRLNCNLRIKNCVEIMNTLLQNTEVKHVMQFILKKIQKLVTFCFYRNLLPPQARFYVVSTKSINMIIINTQGFTTAAIPLHRENSNEHKNRIKKKIKNQTDKNVKLVQIKLSSS